ncbi:RHS repeat-associated core domain-containing protein [Stenotrophomonas rhizophila]|uniref:RHS repeat-associated core domain-containing protein n=1 Tax=Stenotrophomonas rhizophila TaxID=216778 RepID=UPI00112F08AB|nr:RHS repeat-associated core domain-containing protein [Stenotrophomonas rhizophila]
MSIAAKHFDPQLGIDIHMYAMPPCPLPTPHIGLVLDPFDYIPFIGSTIKVNGVHRGTAGTGGLDIHIPLGVWGPPLAAPMGPQFDGEEIFMGSRTVSADGEPFSRLAMPVLDCNLAGMINPFRVKKPKKPLRAMSLPTGLNVAIPTSVKVGGPPTVSWTAMAFRAAFAGLGKLRKTDFFRKKMDAFAAWRRGKWGHLPSGTLKCKILRAEPVDIRDGSVSVSHEDFSIPGRLPLSWRRVYASRHAQRTGACGYGWQTPADIALALSADGSAWLSGPDEVAFFPELPRRDGMDAATLDFVDGARLWRENGQWIVRFKGGLQYHFDATPAAGVAVLPHERSLPIERIEDRCGNHWRFERRDGHLVRIVESGVDGLQGRFIEVDARQGHIDRLQLHDPASGLNHLLVSYRYANGDLIAAVDPLDAPRTFGYQQHYMVRHTDRVGLSFYYAFDAQWRVVHSWGDGGLYDYHFDYDALLHETRITDSLGHVSLVKFDENRLPLCEIDPLDGVTIFEYDDFGRTVAVTDPEGLRTGFEYDERGNLVVLVRPDDTKLALSYDEWDRMTELRTPDGGAWQQRYDSTGLLIEQCDPAQALTRFNYSPQGQLVEQINARQAATQVRYDRHGLVAAITDALGNVSHFEHDARGQLRKQRNALGGASQYQYDAKGRLLEICGEQGAPILCEYDAEDNLVRYTDEAGAQTRFSYVGLGQVARRLQPDGNAVEFRYDTEEQLAEVINQRGESYRVRRDALGRVIEEVDYWGQSKKFEYDSAGRLTGSTDPLGQRLAFRTDRLGRITRRTLADVRHPGRLVHEDFSYDPRGRLVELRNAHRTIRRGYDSVGYLVEEIQDGFRVGFGYDAVGNRVLRETSAGNVIKAEFDACDRVIGMAINGASPIRIERDALGRATREQLSTEVERRFAYDGRNLLTAQAVLRDAAPLFETRYEHDATGNLTRRSDSANGNDEYRYDALGRLLGHTDPKGRIERFFADPAGDRLRTEVKQTQARKVVGSDDEPQGHWTREGGSDGVHYVFDRAGDLVATRKLNVATPDQIELAWDGNHRLAESRRNGQVTHYGYDPLGRRVFKRNPGHTTWFFWDGDALLAEVQQSNDAPEAAPVWIDNVASLIEVRNRQRRIAKLHSQAREYVYYPETFVPLALIDPTVAIPAGHASTPTTVRSEVQPVESSAPPSQVEAEAPMRGVLPQAEPSGAHKEAAAPLRTASAGIGSLGGMSLNTRVEKVAVRAASEPMPGLGSGGMGMLGGGKKPAVTNAPTAAPKENSQSTAGHDDLPSVVEPASGNQSVPTASEDAAASADAKAILLYVNDPNGCPNRLMTESGELVWAAQLSAWAEVRSIDVDVVRNNLRLQGQYFDEETGFNYNRYRYYDPKLGQFIGQDPLTLQAGENLYDFAPSAINWMDALGLSCDEVLDSAAMINLQRRLAGMVNQVRDELLNDPKALQNQLRRKEIDAIIDEPWRMRLFFGTALQRRVTELAEGDSVLSVLKPTRGNAPQDYFGPGGLGYEITGGSKSSIFSHSQRPGVDAVVTYESIPADFGYKWVDWRVGGG